MKRLVILALLTLALPIAASATSNNSFEFSNTGGTLVGSLTTGITLGGSQLVSVQMGNLSPTTGNLGSVSFGTGALTKTSSGWTFSGGTFTISGNGTNGIPSGTLFTGSFSGSITVSHGHYSLSGELGGTSGYYYSLGYKHGFITANLGNLKGLKGRGAAFGSGDTTLTSTPEPETLALFGSGLIALVGLLRRRTSNPPARA